MPKFTVLLTQMVEQTAAVEVEAESPEEARDKVLESDPGVTADWDEGDWADDVECYSVLDETGKVVYER